MTGLWLLQAISLARPNREMGVFTWAAGDMIGAMGTGPPTVHIHLELLSPEEMVCSQGDFAQAPIASAEIHAGPEESVNHRCCAAAPGGE